MRLMHIVATPRTTDSSTLAAAGLLLEALARQDPTLFVDELDLSPAHSPQLAFHPADSGTTLVPVQAPDPECDRSHKHAESLITRFLAADRYLVTVPVWNLEVPHGLKCFLDVIIQPGRLFDYDTRGRVVGLAKHRKMVICASGSDHFSGVGAVVQNYQENYLRVIFDFIGITDIRFIESEPAGPRDAQERQLRASTAAAAGYLIAGPSTLDITDSAGDRCDVPTIPGR
ncbi:MAG: NAD(P)H-dependent oxidoreductase [Actinomycetes bacterium]